MTKQSLRLWVSVALGLSFGGEITARNALARILQGGGFGDARVTPTGTIQTPFGPVNLER